MKFYFGYNLLFVVSFCINIDNNHEQKRGKKRKLIDYIIETKHVLVMSLHKNFPIKRWLFLMLGCWTITTKADYTKNWCWIMNHPHLFKAQILCEMKITFSNIRFMNNKVPDYRENKSTGFMLAARYISLKRPYQLHIITSKYFVHFILKYIQIVFHNT